MIVSVKKHYVTFSSPGTFVSEETRKEIESWDTALGVRQFRTLEKVQS